MNRLLNGIVKVLSSYGLSVVLLLILLGLTYLGTIEQVEMGIYQVQKKYFESLFLIHDFGPFSLPLPGAYPVMVLLFVNLVFGGLIRVRWTFARIGLIIAHVGILFLLAGSFISYRAAIHGNLTLYEGQESNEFRSYYDWQIALYKAPVLRRGEETPPRKEYLIPGNEFAYLREGDSRTFEAEGIPFTLTVRRVMKNARPFTDSQKTPTNPVIDGVFLEELKPEKVEERNLLGAYVDIRPEGSGQTTQTMIWGGEDLPVFVPVGDERWVVELRKKRFQLPFTIHLDKFTHELHPGTGMAKVYMSDVTMKEGDAERKIKIEMNQPLRYKGFTLFQSSWGPQNAPKGTPLFSGFSVVNNPADQWPLWACIVIGLGLAIHFLRLLIRYILAQVGARS